MAVDVIGIMVTRTGIDIIGVEIAGVVIAGMVEIVGPANPTPLQQAILTLLKAWQTKTRTIQKSERLSKFENKNNLKSRLPVCPTTPVIHNL